MAVIRRPQEDHGQEIRQPRARNTGMHDHLVERAARWLGGSCGCSTVLTELRAFTESGEIPDALGWRSDYSILVECKASRADFLADLKKPFRIAPSKGVGTFRFYLCPPALIAPDEVPDSWGLLYAEPRRIQRIIAPIGNIWTHGDNSKFMQPRNKDAEITMLVSAMRRRDNQGKSDC